MVRLLYCGGWINVRWFVRFSPRMRLVRTPGAATHHRTLASQGDERWSTRLVYMPQLPLHRVLLLERYSVVGTNIGWLVWRGYETPSPSIMCSQCWNVPKRFAGSLAVDGKILIRARGPSRVGRRMAFRCHVGREATNATRGPTDCNRIDRPSAAASFAFRPQRSFSRGHHVVGAIRVMTASLSRPPRGALAYSSIPAHPKRQDVGVGETKDSALSFPAQTAFQ
jgi:hypothetical protein